MTSESPSGQSALQIDSTLFHFFSFFLALLSSSHHLSQGHEWLHTPNRETRQNRVHTAIGESVVFHLCIDLACVQMLQVAGDLIAESCGFSWNPVHLHPPKDKHTTAFSEEDEKERKEKKKKKGRNKGTHRCSAVWGH